MTGWRIGWVAGPRDLVQALDTFLSQAAGNCCSVSQAAAAAALNGDQGFVAESVAVYQANGATPRRPASTRSPACRAGLPDGAFYLFVNCGGLIGTHDAGRQRAREDGDVVMYLLESVGVAVVAGAAYGLSPYFRLSIATSLETLEEGVARIARAVAELTEHGTHAGTHADDRHRENPSAPQADPKIDRGAAGDRGGAAERPAPPQPRQQRAAFPTTARRRWPGRP